MVSTLSRLEVGLGLGSRQAMARGATGIYGGVPWGDGHVISDEIPLKTINHGLISIKMG